MEYKQAIQRSLDYIEENIKGEISARELADMAGFSLYHYYRLFQSVTGMSVMHYIQRRRLLHGIYAVKQGSTRVDAALDFGFDTYAGFYRAFRREFGCTPTEFLQTCRAKKPCRVDLNQEEHNMLTQKKAARLLTNWNLEGATLSDVYHPETGARKDNACLVGGTYILKVTGNYEKLENHIRLSAALEAVGLSAGAPVPTRDGRLYIRDGDLYAYLTERLEGERLGAGCFYEAGGENRGRFVGEILGHLHDTLREVGGIAKEADLYRTVSDWALPKAKECLELSDGFCKGYLDTLGDLYPKLPRQIIHRDPNPGNIIGGGNKWGLIDFELAEKNARIYDPCYAATAILSESFDGAGQEKLQQWLRIYRSIFWGYDAVAHMTREEKQAAPYLLLANQFVCVAWFAEQEKYAELFAVNREMTRWIIRHFSELKLED